MEFKRKGYLAGIGSGMSWGLDAVMLGIVMGMAPFVEDPCLLLIGGILAAALHDVFAALWMLIIMGAKGRLKEFVPAIKSKDGMWCAFAALFGGPLAMTFDVLAIAEGGAALAATVTACYPLLGTALAMVVLKEKMTLQAWLGLFVCVCGIIWIGYAPNQDTNINVVTGTLLALVAAIGWATEAVVCGYGMKGDKVDPQIALLIREITSGVFYLLVVVPIMAGSWDVISGGYHAVFSSFPVWGLLALTALVGMCSFFMWYTSIDTIGAAKALCQNVTYAFWSVIFSLILLGGDVTMPVAIGSVLIITGVAIATLMSSKKKD